MRVLAEFASTKNLDSARPFGLVLKRAKKWSCEISCSQIHFLLQSTPLRMQGVFRARSCLMKRG